MTTSREQFFETVQQALRDGADADSPGLPSTSPTFLDPARCGGPCPASPRGFGPRTGLSSSPSCGTRPSAPGCVVSPVRSVEKAAEYIGPIVRSLEAHLVVRSSHVVLDRMGIDGTLSAAGVELMQTASSEGGSMVKHFATRWHRPTSEYGGGLRHRRDRKLRDHTWSRR